MIDKSDEIVTMTEKIKEVKEEISEELTIILSTTRSIINAYSNRGI